MKIYIYYNNNIVVFENNSIFIVIDIILGHTFLKDNSSEC